MKAPKLPQSTERMVTLLILTFALVNFWILDVSVELMGGTVENGFWEMEAVKSYHITLALSTLSTVVLAVMLVRR